MQLIKDLCRQSHAVYPGMESLFCITHLREVAASLGQAIIIRAGYQLCTLIPPLNSWENTALAMPNHHTPRHHLYFFYFLFTDNNNHARETEAFWSLAIILWEGCKLCALVPPFNSGANTALTMLSPIIPPSCHHLYAKPQVYKFTFLCCFRFGSKQLPGHDRHALFIVGLLVNIPVR